MRACATLQGGASSAVGVTLHFSERQFQDLMRSNQLLSNAKKVGSCNRSGCVFTDECSPAQPSAARCNCCCTASKVLSRESPARQDAVASLAVCISHACVQTRLTAVPVAVQKQDAQTAAKKAAAAAAAGGQAVPGHAASVLPQAAAGPAQPLYAQGGFMAALQDPLPYEVPLSARPHLKELVLRTQPPLLTPHPRAGFCCAQLLQCGALALSEQPEGAGSARNALSSGWGAADP